MRREAKKGYFGDHGLLGDQKLDKESQPTAKVETSNEMIRELDGMFE